MKKLDTFVKNLALTALLIAVGFAYGIKPADAITYARTQTANLTSATSGTAMLMRNGESFTYTIVNAAWAGSNPVGTTVLERSCDGTNFGNMSVAVSTTNNSAGSTVTDTLTVESCPGGKVWMRFRQSDWTSGISSTTIAETDNLLNSFRNNNNESIRDYYDGGTQFNGYLKVLGNTATVSSAAVGGVQAKIRGFYTSAQIEATTFSLGDILFITSNAGSNPAICLGTGTTATTAAAVYVSTTGATVNHCK